MIIQGVMIILGAIVIGFIVLFFLVLLLELSGNVSRG